MAAINTAVIVGSNWGLIHLTPLRQAGVEVSALLGTDRRKTQAIAQQQGIPLGTTCRCDLGDPDLVVVACPAQLHRHLITQFPRSAIICEKPLQGVDDYPHPLPAWANKLWVNYAFAQLHSAQQASELLQAKQSVSHIHLRSTVNLPQSFTLEQWFLETASHPLSWLLHLYGPPQRHHKSVVGQQLQLVLQCNDTKIHIDFQQAGAPGIFHQFEFKAADTQLSFSGCYRPGEKWHFSPLVLNGEAVNQGEYSDSDCWLDANQRSIKLILQVLRGEISAATGLSRGLFDMKKALALEKLICS